MHNCDKKHFTRYTHIHTYKWRPEVRQKYNYPKDKLQLVVSITREFPPSSMFSLSLDPSPIKQSLRPGFVFGCFMWLWVLGKEIGDKGQWFREGKNGRGEGRVSQIDRHSGQRKLSPTQDLQSSWVECDRRGEHGCPMGYSSSMTDWCGCQPGSCKAPT
jgi:hypothetical protein